MSLKHASVGDQLTRAEWEGDDLHELNGQPAADVIVTSIPPLGMCRIINIYYDPEQDKAIVQYDDQPVG